MGIPVKEINIKQHGNFIYGTLDGVDFVPSGKLENGTPYGASVKLKFIMKTPKTRTVAGEDITTMVATSQVLKIACEDEDLAKLVHKYNELDGKDLLINYSPKRDGDTFNIYDESDILLVK